MATAAQLRKIVLSFVDVEERSHMDHPDFRREGKIFAGLTKDEETATLKLSPEIQASLLYDGSPFRPAAGAWGRGGWTQVELAGADVAVLKELCREAWHLVATKKSTKRAAEKLDTSRAKTKTKTNAMPNAKPAKAKTKTRSR